MNRCGHFVQFYKADEPMLNRNVGQFLWEALLRGDGLVVLATRARRECLAGYLSRLGAEVPLVLKERQLVMLDAEEMLGRVMVDSEPDWRRFRTVIGGALESVRPRGAGAAVCAYGEMVGVLWERGERRAAIRLEEYWNKLLESSRLTLFCGYPIDVFGEEFATSDVRDILDAHTHVMPTGRNGDLSEAVQLATDDVLGVKASELWTSTNGGNPSVPPTGERAILWLREKAPNDAEGILVRARRHFEATRAE